MPKSLRVYSSNSTSTYLTEGRSSFTWQRQAALKCKLNCYKSAIEIFPFVDSQQERTSRVGSYRVSHEFSRKLSLPASSITIMIIIKRTPALLLTRPSKCRCLRLVRQQITEPSVLSVFTAIHIINT